MAVDAHKNFAASLVATAPSPASSGTSLVVTGGDGTKFPAVPFNATIWPANSQPTTANAEIVRVTARSTDTLTITRAQESTSARTVVIGDQIAATITAKTLTDVEIPGAGAQAATVATSETTASASYANLTTTSDTVTVTIGPSGVAIVVISCGGLGNTTANGENFVSFDVSGANTIAAADTNALSIENFGTALRDHRTFVKVLTGLTAGSTTFKMKYRVNAGTGTFVNRDIAVIPL